MNKQFTINIPNELYSSENTLNKSLTLEYNGPEILHVIVNPGRLSFSVIPEATETSVALDASTHPEVAYLLTNAPITTQYQFTEEVLDNGEIYNNIINPNLHDYYTVSYNNQNEWVLLPILREQKTPGLIKAQNLSTSIQNIIDRTSLADNPLELEAEIVTELSQYLNVLSQYIQVETPKKAWKYITYTSAPSVPENLVKFLGE